MTVDRRALFDFALLLHRQLQQQEQQRKRQQDQEDAAGSDDEAKDDTEDADTEGFVHVAHTDALAGGGGGVRLHSWQAPQMLRPAAACVPQVMMAQAAVAPKVRFCVQGHLARVDHAVQSAEGFAGFTISCKVWWLVPVCETIQHLFARTPCSAANHSFCCLPDNWSCKLHLQAARVARGIADAAELSARQQLAAAAAVAAHLAPKETQEWVEAGWWKCQGHGVPARLIPREC
jgi:hypothetical protein